MLSKANHINFTESSPFHAIYETFSVVENVTALTVCWYIKQLRQVGKATVLLQVSVS